MKTRIVRIGNSRGVRIPKPLLEEAGLVDDVELRVVDMGIVIQKVSTPRMGWAEAAAELSERGGGELLDGVTSTDFDESGWAW